MPIILATQELEMGQPRKKISQTPILTNKLGVVVPAGNPSYVGSIHRKITVTGQLDTKKDPI
jgi:hypothetical protein